MNDAPLRIARVFPRRTNATPDDALSFVNCGPGLWPPDVDEVHVSATFSYDVSEAKRLAGEWERLGVPVRIGGPACGDRGEEFVPGRYLKKGYVITSRGCPNCCAFCDAWRREGRLVRELPIVDGWNVLDSNLLACRPSHILNVFTMLKEQMTRPEFTGGLEAARLEAWHAEALRALRPKTIFLAYDTPDDWEPLVRASELLWNAGFTKGSHVVRAYVLCGRGKDTLEAAERRLRQAASLGILPMAMAFRDTAGKITPQWRTFQRHWARPASVAAMAKQATTSSSSQRAPIAEPCCA